MPLPQLDHECFFIAPIGADGSPERDRSDGVLNYIVADAARAVGLEAIRADRIAKPGQITLQVIDHVLGAKAAVADLTGQNPNVYYELAVRHAAKLPVVLIAEDGEKLPFDLGQMRTIFFNHTDLKSASECRAEIQEHLRQALDGAVDSPIATTLDIRALRAGDTVERSVAELVTNVDGLARQMSDLQGMTLALVERGVGSRGTGVGSAAEFAYERVRRLIEMAVARGDPELQELAAQMRDPLEYILRRDPSLRRHDLPTLEQSRPRTPSTVSPTSTLGGDAAKREPRPRVKPVAAM